MIGTKDNAVLRLALPEDMPQIDEITIVCYTAIHESWVAMQGEEIYEALRETDKTWEERKTGQNHELFAEHPEWVWVLEIDSQIIGFVTFKIIDIVAEKKLGIIENNGVVPEHAGNSCIVMFSTTSENKISVLPSLRLVLMTHTYLLEKPTRLWVLTERLQLHIIGRICEIITRALLMNNLCIFHRSTFHAWDCRQDHPLSARIYEH